MKVDTFFFSVTSKTGCHLPAPQNDFTLPELLLKLPEALPMSERQATWCKIGVAGDILPYKMRLKRVVVFRHCELGQ